MQQENPTYKFFGISDIPEELGRGRLSDEFLIFDNLEIDHFPKEYASTIPVKNEDILSLHVVCGFVSIRVNMKEVKVQANEILTLMPDCAFQMIEESDDFKFFAFSINMELFAMLNKSLEMQVGLTSQRFCFYLGKSSEADFLGVRSIYNLLKKEFDEPDYPQRRDVVRRYLEILALKDLRFYMTDKFEEGLKPTNRRDMIYRDFLRLLEVHYKEQHSISFYADQMCVTPKYLSTIVRQMSGKPGLQWIDEYLAMEAKALVHQGRLSVKEISDRLNFPTQSMFGRFFKKMTGYSPKQYREL